VSHVALGSIRVMGTCAILGQATGVAAALCKKYKCFPRDIYKFHIKKFQQELLKQDCYIPTIKNEDDNDLALKGKIKVSSIKKLEFPKPEKYEKTDLGLAQSFVISANIKKIILYLENKSKKSVIGKIHLRKSEFIDDFRNEKDIAVIESIIKPGISKVEFPFPELNLEINRPYWIFLEGNKDLYWGYSSIEPIGTCAGKMTNGWTVSEFLKDTTLAITRIRGTFCLELIPEMFPYNGEQVISGITRPEKSPNLWISDKGLPQWIEIYCDKVVEFNVLHLTFDNNLDREVKEIHRLRIPPELVKEYDVFVEKEGQEVKILSVKDNYLRKRVHFFEKMKTRRLKIVILKTNGIEEARIYEIRVYNIKKKNF